MSGLGIATYGLVHIYRTEGHDVAALSGVTLSVAAGEMVGLLGPSGSGKSTLLQSCAGLLRPSAGRVTVGARDLARLGPPELDHYRAVDLGILLQGSETNLVPYLSCAENIVFAQSAAARAGKAAGALLAPDDAMRLVGLTGAGDRMPSDLTPGHLQLLALAAAVSHRPALLLADEPTSRLGHEARDTVLDALFRINAELGTTLLLVTHDPVVAARLPRTVTIRDGRIGAEGRAGEEFAVVTADGSLPLPAHALEAVPPGTLLRLVATEDGFEAVRVEEDP